MSIRAVPCSTCGKTPTRYTDEASHQRWCRNCYRRHTLYGDPAPARRTRKTDRRTKSTTPLTGTESGCWEWAGARVPKDTGYGYTRWDGRYGPVHRFVYEAIKGTIDDGQVVMHRCDNPPCCNPDHLVLGTHADNARDRDRKGRNAGALTFEDAQFIRANHVAGKNRYQRGNTAELADQFGVHPSTILACVNEITWVP